MKLGREPQGLNASTLKVVGQSVEFAADIGEMSFADLGDDDSAAFGANLQAAEIGSRAAQGIVSSVQAFLKARVGGVVETMGAEQQQELAQRQYGIGQERVRGAASFAPQGTGVVWRRPRRGRLRAGPVIEQS